MSCTGTKYGYSDILAIGRATARTGPGDKSGNSRIKGEQMDPKEII
jgi:hypothetical protein